MEQTTQQINQKPTLPIKTKVAAWWMILLGGLTIIEGFIFIFPGGLTGDITDIFIFIFIISIFLFFMIPSFFLLRRKRIAWWLYIIIISINLIFALFCLIKTRSFFDFGTLSLGRFPILLPLYLLTSKRTFFELYGYVNGFEFILYTIPFILLLLDRKNFWKIAT